MIGKTISHYTILEKLGSGGMGVVYKAHDTRLDRFVALKFLPSHVSQSDTDKARFLQEARAAAALNHPNVCVIHEIHDEGENPFIVMEYVEGRTLRDVIGNAGRRGEARMKISGNESSRGDPAHTGHVSHLLPVSDVIHIAMQIAGALHAAHEKGIVHRDVKSENIMVTQTGQVKVMDFGLAKIRGSAKLTRESSTLGTLAYMPPEYIQGQEVDARADIFSFGVVLYEMLTGQLPFKGEYDSAMMYAIVNEEPEPLTKYRPDLSSEILHMMNRALEKDPEDRYQSVRDMRIDLKRLERETEKDSGKRAGGPEKESPVTRPAEGKKRIKRTLLVIAAGLTLLIAASSSLFTIFRNRTDSASGHFSWKNSIAVLPFHDASPEKDQQYFCDGMTEEVITHLARNHELKVISKTSVDYFKDSGQALQTVGKKLGVRNIVEGSIRKDGDMIRVTVRLIDLENDVAIWTDHFDRELNNVIKVQEEIARAISEALEIRFIPPDKKAVTMDPQAQEYFLRSTEAITNYTLSSQEKDFELVLEYANKALEIDPESALVYAGLAWAYNIRYSLTGDLAYREPVMRYCLRAYQLDPDLPETNIAMAYALLSQGQFERAAHHSLRAYKLNSNLAEVNHTIGLILYSSGLEDRAISYFKKAAEINPFNLFTPNMLGASYRNCGKFSEAELEYRKALDLSLSHPLPNIELAEVLISTNRLDEAEQCLNRVGEGSSHDKIYRGVKALLHAARGEREQALSVTSISENIKGRVYACLGMQAEAIACLEAGSETSYLRLTSDPFYNRLRHSERFPAVSEQLKGQYNRMNKIFKDL